MPPPPAVDGAAAADLLRAVDHAKAWLATDGVVGRLCRRRDPAAARPVAPLTPLDNDRQPRGRPATRAALQAWLRGHRARHPRAAAWRYLLRWRDHYAALEVPAASAGAPPAAVLFDPHAGGWLGYPDPTPWVRGVFPDVTAADVPGQPCQRAPHDTLCAVWAVRWLATGRADGGLPAVLDYLRWAAVEDDPGDFAAYLRDDAAVAHPRAVLDALRRPGLADRYVAAFYGPRVRPPDADGHRCVAWRAGRCARRRARGPPGFGGRDCPDPPSPLERLDCLRGACRALCATGQRRRAPADRPACWRVLREELPPLVAALTARTQAAFPAAAPRAPAGEAQWGCRGRGGACQWRGGGAWPSCDGAAQMDPWPRLSCAWGALRRALRELDAVRTSAAVPTAVAAFLHRLDALRDRLPPPPAPAAALPAAVVVAPPPPSPCDIDLAALRIVTEADLAALATPGEPVTHRVVDAYIAALQVHYRRPALCLCYASLEAALRTGDPSGAVARAPSPFAAGRVTCLPVLAPPRGRRGVGHWYLCVVDRREAVGGMTTAVYVADSLPPAAAPRDPPRALAEYVRAGTGWTGAPLSARGPRQTAPGNDCALYLLRNLECIGRRFPNAPWRHLNAAYFEDFVLDTDAAWACAARVALADYLRSLRRATDAAAVRAALPVLYNPPSTLMEVV